MTFVWVSANNMIFQSEIESITGNFRTDSMLLGASQISSYTSVGFAPSSAPDQRKLQPPKITDRPAFDRPIWAQRPDTKVHLLIYL